MDYTIDSFTETFFIIFFYLVAFDDIHAPEISEDHWHGLAFANGADFIR
jgi:hypothetical protein